MKRYWLLALTALVCIGVFGATSSSALAACANPVACDNALPGDPLSDWEVTGAGDSSIQGFATSMSVNVGQTISFKIDTPSTKYHIDILRLGYYGTDGARMIQAGIQPTAKLPQTQPACQTDSSTGLIDCGNWSVSASWTVPSTAVSGVYIAHLVRDDGSDPGGDSQIPFVVRNDSSHSSILVVTSDATWEAYNDYGGNSLYTCTVACPPGNPLAYKAAYAVSYNRPFDGSLQTDLGASYLYYAEYQMIRFLEENGYDVSYASDSDVASNPSLLLNHKMLLFSGHDEYWSGSMLANVKAALAAGVNLSFFTGNEIFWKTRWAPDSSNAANRTLITYKETHFNGPVDPDDPPTWTGAWDDPRFSPPADGGVPSNALTGQLFVVNSGSADITVPYQYSKLRLWRNTSVAKLTTGQSQTLSPGTDTLGYEWDVDADNGFRPAGEFDMSSTTVKNVQPFLDYGSTTGTGTETHHLTLYRAPSGALVFGAGTVQWSWGLDNMNAWDVDTTDPGSDPPDPTMQQATVNLFADMGVQPTTLISGLTPAATSTDRTPPTSSITSPSANSSFADGTAVTISGTATDAGGGVVAGVEVSTDGGTTWHPATTTGPDATTVSWTYSWTAQGNPSAKILSRATDDSGNIETPSAGISVNVSCPCSLWGSGTPGGATDSGDGNAVSVGMQFESDTYGQVSALRFYKVAADTGTHVGSLWTANGTLLASATFTGETGSGWQQVALSSPVTIQPHTVYVASYYAPSGHYAATPNYFYPAPAPGPQGGGTVSNAPLHALIGSTNPNGLFTYGGNVFPTSSYQNSNYWVDIQFQTLPVPGQVTGVSATAGKAQASVSWSAPSSGGPVTSYTITPYIGSTAQTTTVVNGSPPATSATVRGLTPGSNYTFVVTASNPNGNGLASAASNSVTPTAPTPPTAPTGVSATSATSSALISWTGPSDDGGSAVTGYTITPYIGSAAQTATQVSGASTTSATVTGLTNGSGYTFTITANNLIGSSAASSASNSVTPANTIFDFATPATPDSGDGNGVTLGVAFKSSQAGWITGVRFYKSQANTGTHVGALWTAGGTLLTSATFTGETATGWQQVTFPTPIEIAPGTTYVASYYAPNGHYAVASSALSSAVTNGPLQTIPDGSTPDGAFAYGNGSVFPNTSYKSSNYYVDAMFAPMPVPGQVTGVSATAGKAQASVSWSAPSSGGPVTSYTITPYIGSTAQTTTVVNGSPPATSATVRGLTPGSNYTFVVTASNPNGNGLASAASNSVTPTAPTPPTAPTGVSATSATSSALISWTGPSDDGGSAVTGYTITPYIGSAAQTATQVSGASTTSATVTGLTNGSGYTFTITANNLIGSSAASSASNSVTPANTIFDFATPATPDSGDGNGVTLGVAFKSSQAGWITGVRFYKSQANTGTHVGALWTAGGTLLTSATFTGETATGWQQVTFPTPIEIAPGTTYVASYYAPNGHYAVASSALSSAVTNGPLQTIPDGSTPDGAFAYGNGSVFPNTSYKSSNYYVDPTFQINASASAPPAPSGVAATPATSSALVSWTDPGSDGGSPITGYTITPYIGSTAQTTTRVSGASTANTTVTGLTNGTAYTFTVAATNSVGTGSPSAASTATTPDDTIFDFATPTVIDSGDASSATLGVKFTANVSGNVTGLRFYKAPNNTGTHIGGLWDANGNLLASATFNHETASGWQDVSFSQPVSVTAGTTYVASYYAPNGHYSVTSNGLASIFSNPPLQALATSTSPNGVYSYGSALTFPTSTFNAANYWVDVLFSGS